jgi:hypothetical protein
MKIYTIIHAINEYGSPRLETSHYFDLVEARNVFDVCVKSVGEDYASIYLEEFDTETKKGVFVECFEGNDESLSDDEECDG